MRVYETGTIFNPDIPEDKIGELISKIEGEIEKAGGKIVEIDQWGMRKLAFSIAKHPRGYYTFFKFAASPSAVAKIEYMLRVFEDVIRFMTIKREEEIEEKELASISKVLKKPDSAPEEPEEVITGGAAVAEDMDAEENDRGGDHSPDSSIGEEQSELAKDEENE